MFVKDVNGDLVNLETGLTIQQKYQNIYVFVPHHENVEATLFNGTEEKCQEYMAELQRELAAFGKLVKVEVGK